MSPKAKYVEINAEKVIFDHSTRLFPFSPRKEIDPSLVDRIKRSIAETGNWQPIVIRAGTLEGIAGNHRFLALVDLAKEQNTDLGDLKIPAMVVKCDEGMAVTIALAENEFRENLTQWETVRAIIKSVEKKPKVAETIFEVDGETVEQLRLWDKELDYDAEYQARRRELQARLTREWVAVINTRLGEYPELRKKFLEQLRHPTWVHAQSLSDLNRAITSALRSFGVRFEQGRTWNEVPSPKCLSNCMEYSNIRELLNGVHPQLVLRSDGGAAELCPHLRLFPEYIMQIQPEETNVVVMDEPIGEKRSILDHVDTYCIAPDVHQPGSCFQNQEEQAATASKKQLSQRGLQSVLPGYIDELGKLGQFFWSAPHRDGEICTPENCRQRSNKKPGIVVLAKPGGLFDLICINDKCGQAAKDKLVDWEAKQVQATQQRQQEALESLRRLTVEQTLLSPDRQENEWLNRPILDEIEKVLVQDWDVSTMFHIYHGWESAMHYNIAKELGIDYSSRELNRIFRERFLELPEKPTNNSIRQYYSLLRTRLVQSDACHRRWLACLALVRMWRDNVETIDQIEQAKQKILMYK